MGTIQPYYTDELFTLYAMDCEVGMKELPDNSVDLLCTDPPYGYSFMGKDWDKAVPKVEIWKECLRILKPGAFAFVMSAPRQDVLSRMIVNLQDAGFDAGFTSIYWTYSSGFPKAENIGKMVDKQLGCEREVIGHKNYTSQDIRNNSYDSDKAKDRERLEVAITQPTSDKAKALDGSYGGFQPKPALECIIRAQKPLTKQLELTIITSMAIELLEVIVKYTNVLNVVSNIPEDMVHIVRERVTAKTIEEAIAQIGMVEKFSLTDISQSILVKMKKDMSLTNWNIGLLWKSILVDLLSQMNKYTIEMVLELIIELKTLNSLISANIQENTIAQNVTQQNGLQLNVGIVESILTSVLIKSPLLNQTSVPTTAISDICIQNQNGYANNAGKNLIQTIPNEDIVLSNVTGRQCKPEVKVILVAMKPLSEKTFVAQALENQKGITWLDDCRVPTNPEVDDPRLGGKGDWSSDKMAKNVYSGGYAGVRVGSSPLGRFPANLLVSDDVLNDGVTYKTGGKHCQTDCGDSIFGKRQIDKIMNTDNGGSFSRYFDLDKWWDERIKSLPQQVQETYPFLICPKASKGEKNIGCEDLDDSQGGVANDSGRGYKLVCTKCNHRQGICKCNEPDFKYYQPTVKNNHPTVKPLKLMSYLVTLGSRPNDLVLDPFIGSGTTGRACKMLNRKCIGFEIDVEQYAEIAKHRQNKVQMSLI